MTDIALTIGAFVCIYTGEAIRGGEYVTLRGWIGCAFFCAAVLLAQRVRCS